MLLTNRDKNPVCSENAEIHVKNICSENAMGSNVSELSFRIILRKIDTSSNGAFI